MVWVEKGHIHVIDTKECISPKAKIKGNFP